MLLTGHVWIVQGTPEDLPRVLDLLRENGIEPTANADVYTRVYTTLGIDDVQDISRRARLRAHVGRRVFILAAPTITVEAQNAFLKTLEEPTAESLFVLVVPTPYTLLPTILSRTSHIVQLSRDTIVTNRARTFLRSTPPERVAQLSDVLEKTDEDTYDTVHILGFVTEVELALATIPDAHARAESIRILYELRQYMTDRGAMIKTLLEALAFLLPVI